MITQEQLDTCTRIARHFGAKRLVLFGSAVENPEQARDIDLICEGVEGLDFFRMSAQMEEAVRVPIDLIPIPPQTRFIRYVLSNGKILYEN